MVVLELFIEEEKTPLPAPPFNNPGLNVEQTTTHPQKETLAEYMYSTYGIDQVFWINK